MTPSYVETQEPGEKPWFGFIIIFSYYQKIQWGKVNRQQA